MNDEELESAWRTMNPTLAQRRRIDERVSTWIEARDTSLVAEWIGVVRVAPFSSVGLVTVSAISILLTATPLLLAARALL